MSVKLFPGNPGTQAPITVRQTDVGIDVLDPDGTTPGVRLRNNADVNYTSIFVNAGTDLFIDHQIDSETVVIRGRDSGSANSRMAVFDPDGAADFYYNNVIKLSTTADGIAISNTTAEIIAGSGTPESAVTAPVGSIYMRTDGGASTSIYVKESGSGNTGWAAK